MIKNVKIYFSFVDVHIVQIKSSALEHKRKSCFLCNRKYFKNERGLNIHITKKHPRTKEIIKKDLKLKLSTMIMLNKLPDTETLLKQYKGI